MTVVFEEMFPMNRALSSTLIGLSAITLSDPGFRAYASDTFISFDDLGPEVTIADHYASFGITFLNAKTVEYRSGKPVFCAFAGASGK